MKGFAAKVESFTDAFAFIKLCMVLIAPLGFFMFAGHVPELFRRNCGIGMVSSANVARMVRVKSRYLWCRWDKGSIQVRCPEEAPLAQGNNRNRPVQSFNIKTQIFQKDWSFDSTIPRKVINLLIYLEIVYWS